MPKDGYATITVKDKTFKLLRDEYEKYKENLKLIGINNFSDYIESFTKKKPTDLDDIKGFLCVNNQVLIIMFDLMIGTDKDVCQTNMLRAKQHMFEFLQKFQNQ